MFFYFLGSAHDLPVPIGASVWIWQPARLGGAEGPQGAVPGLHCAQAVCLPHRAPHEAGLQATGRQLSKIRVPHILPTSKYMLHSPVIGKDKKHWNITYI